MTKTIYFKPYEGHTLDIDDICEAEKTNIPETDEGYIGAIITGSYAYIYLQDQFIEYIKIVGEDELPGITIYRSSSNSTDTVNIILSAETEVYPIYQYVGLYPHLHFIVQSQLYDAWVEQLNSSIGNPDSKNYSIEAAVEEFTPVTLYKNNGKQILEIYGKNGRRVNELYKSNSQPVYTRPNPTFVIYDIDSYLQFYNNEEGYDYTSILVLDNWITEEEIDSAARNDIIDLAERGTKRLEGESMDTLWFAKLRGQMSPYVRRTDTIVRNLSIYSTENITYTSTNLGATITGTNYYNNQTSTVSSSFATWFMGLSNISNIKFRGIMKKQSETNNSFYYFLDCKNIYNIDIDVNLKTAAGTSYRSSFRLCENISNVCGKAIKELSGSGSEFTINFESCKNIRNVTLNTSYTPNPNTYAIDTQFVYCRELYNCKCITPFDRTFIFLQNRFLYNCGLNSILDPNNFSYCFNSEPTATTNPVSVGDEYGNYRGDQSFADITYPANVNLDENITISGSINNYSYSTCSDGLVHLTFEDDTEITVKPDNDGDWSLTFPAERMGETGTHTAEISYMDLTETVEIISGSG